jgi:sulfonate transport system ATP-binding protein
MAQRAALARALIGRPEVLLMDEPFASLDALTRMQMQDLVAETFRTFNPTVALVTHDIDEALFLADRVVILGQLPATIVETQNVTIKRPRDRADPEISRLKSRILALFGFSHAYNASAEESGRPLEYVI